jgi:hypothetical protein
MMKEKATAHQAKLKRRLIAVMLLNFSVIIIVLTIFVILTIRNQTAKQTLWIDEEMSLIQEVFERQISDAFFLASYTEPYIDGLEVDTAHLEDVFLKFAQSKSVYYQVKFIDTTGQERVKIQKMEKISIYCQRMCLRIRAIAIIFQRILKTTIKFIFRVWI